MEKNIDKIVEKNTGWSCPAEHDYKFAQTLHKQDEMKSKGVKLSGEKAYITFSDKMIVSVREHSDKTKIDKRTNDVMKICAIKLPSKDYRTLQFDKDSNGLDRNDRIASVNVVQSFVKDNRDKDGKLLNHYTYLDANREYNVNFKSVEIGQENGKKIFDKPVQVKLTGAELTKMFKENREKSLNKKKEKSTKEKDKEKEDNAKSKPKVKKEKKTEVSR